MEIRARPRGWGCRRRGRRLQGKEAAEAAAPAPAESGTAHAKKTTARPPSAWAREE